MTNKKRTGREDNGRKKFDWPKREKEPQISKVGIPIEADRKPRDTRRKDQSDYYPNE